MDVASSSSTWTFTGKLTIVLISAIISHVIYLGSGPLSYKLFQWTKFPYASQRTWRSRVTSMAHALTVGALGFYTLFIEGKLDMEAVWTSTNMSTLTMCISAGYFLWDSIVVLYEVYAYHAMALLMFEWSTPAMNAFFMCGSIVDALQERATPFMKQLQFKLSVFFALSFFAVRMVWGNYHYYQFYRVCFNLWGVVPNWFNISLLALIVVAFLLNGTWMLQIVITGIRVLAKKEVPPLDKNTTFSKNKKGVSLKEH